MASASGELGTDATTRRQANEKKNANCSFTIATPTLALSCRVAVCVYVCIGKWGM